METNFFTAFFNEAGKQPLATFLCIVGILVFFYWFVWQRPKEKAAKHEASQRQHDDSVALASHIATSNEVIRHSSAVIENNSAVIANNTQATESVKGVISSLCDGFGEVKARLDTVNEKVGRIDAVITDRR